MRDTVSPCMSDSPVGAAALGRVAAEWLTAGEPAVVVELARVRGSVPREVGARMLVGAGRSAGTIGGGRLEFEAIAHARDMLAGRCLPRAGSVTCGTGREVRDFALGASLGQCCGGAATLVFTCLDAAVLASWPRELMRFHAEVFGAGHVGRQVVRLLGVLPCTVSWTDSRPGIFDGMALPATVTLNNDDLPEDEVKRAPPGAAFLVFTHSHALDERVVEAILRRADFSYAGLIGSSTKRARFAHRLVMRGMDPATLQRLDCPMGMPGIDGKAPAVIAIAIVARLLQLFPEPVYPTA